ncbi:MAG: S8 family serine peptidase, partial [Rothia sp. (in: high G+C Gram-positive bacteria)]|nr:S8 family serine peptidase [Rothia sp. (in: high G+C Gram-positive bacteria)]
MSRSPFFQSVAGTCSLVLATGFLVTALPTAGQAAPPQGAFGDAAYQGQVAGGPDAGTAGEMTTRYQPRVEPDTDRLVVKFKEGVVEQEQAEILDDIAEATPAVEVAEISHETVEQAQVVDVQEMMTPSEQAQIVELLEEQPEVEYAEPDLIISAGQAATPRNPPNDPYFAGYQWNMRAIDAPGAWKYATGEGVVIGVADTGQTWHPELAAKTLPGYDFVSADQSRDGNGWDSNPNDEGDWGPQVPRSMWHGTHVAGIAAAFTDNGVGVAGVAPNARIQHARIMGVNGRAYTSDQAAGVAWSAGVPVPGAPANPTPAAVVNYSEGFYSPTCPQVLQDAINAAHARNVPVVAAAGNFGANAAGTSPANCLGAIVVGATASGNRMTGYSNWGPMLDVVAPGGAAGSDIWSTVNTGAYTQVGPGYGPLNGTSMAAPHVTGIVALMKERDPNLTVEQIRSILKNTGTSVNGYRLVNAPRAVS